MRSFVARYRACAFLVLGLAATLCAVAQPRDSEDQKQGEKGPGAGEAAQGPPPALVVVGEVTSGSLAPTAEFVGTVYYREVSDVAAEVSGKVQRVHFEEGDVVSRGDKLVELEDELLGEQLKTARANYDSIQTDIEKADVDLKRAEELFQQKSISEEEYDNARFAFQRLERQGRGLKAIVDRIETELKKKVIYAPFDGQIITKQSEVGEWLDSGDPVASLADTRMIDVILNVPGSVLPYVHQQMAVESRINGKTYTGKVLVILPRGDVATRTFPIKVRYQNDGSLIEGMEAHALLPNGPKQDCLILPRDAVLPQGGTNQVFSVEDGIAQPHPVDVIGYESTRAGVRADGLRSGMQVVIKGNERLRPGQPVNIMSSLP